MVFNAVTPHAIATELGDRIKVARLKADLTQKKLAEKTGISPKAVTNSGKENQHLNLLLLF